MQRYDRKGVATEFILWEYLNCAMANHWYDVSCETISVIV